jgi:hypothetical protein
MKENKGNNEKKDNSDIKIKNNFKLEESIKKIKTPNLLSEKDLSSQNRDIILKTKYSATLKSSAENFLVDLFEKISTINNFENVNLEVPISAAMAIITNTSWHQPTEAQIEYDFTRECIDKGIHTVVQVEESDYDLEDEYYIENVEEELEQNKDEEVDNDGEIKINKNDIDGENDNKNLEN